MNNNLKRIMIASMIPFLFLTGCTKKEEKPEEPEDESSAVTPETLGISDYPIVHETEFGGVYIEMTIEDFNALGFEYGDSVDVVFSNGYRLDDIPYYNGYYVDPGNPLLIGYPGYDYIKATVNYGQDLWDTANLKIGAEKEEKPDTGLWLNADLEEHDTASVYLHEKGKYLDIEQASDIHYKDERDQFPSDEVFANFRAVNMGNLKENVIYRSASPCDNQHKRAPFVNDLIEQAGVNAIMDLADTEVKIERYINADDFSSPYFLSLYEDGKVLPIALNMNFYSEEFAAKTAKGFADLSKLDTPYLIHCTEGKDRTGFVCMLVEMLAGSDYQAIVDDYMITYDNYYQITKEKDPARYDVILQRNLIAMMKYVTGADEDGLKTADLAAAAEKYLLNAGMSEEDIAAFKAKILK
jgi:protein tyrosine/serine phosphatase